MSSENDKYILAKYDVSGIQDYIFATNRLRENAGASFQITRILEEFFVEAFREAASQEAAAVVLDWKGEDKLHLAENEDIRGEIIYIGGGNAIALFRDMALFRKVGQKLGMKAAATCEGIHLAAAYIKTPMENFFEDRKKLDKEMEKMKRNMARQPFFSPFPVVEQDNASHQPITCGIRYGEEIENATRIQFQKREAYKGIAKYQRLYPQIENGRDYGYPEEMDELCREHGEDSMIAIVHIDGNGMGERIQDLLRSQRKYQEGVFAIRKESKKISDLFQKTYAGVLKELWDNRVFLKPDGLENDKKEKRLFPLRPIILDGDDFTFLCRAELAVPVAAKFMIKLMEMQANDKKKITACGGIAFVHSHFPFRVAYTIAEESCMRAKQKWYKEIGGKGGRKASCYLDFEVIKESEVGLPSKNREQQKRPYLIRLDKSEPGGDSLRKLYGILKRMEDWPSGRLHKIYRAMQEGNDRMEFLDRELKSRGYEIDKLAQGNWQDSPLFDALELKGLCRVDLLKEFL